MNRRTFLKIGLSMLAAACSPRLPEMQEEGTKMRYGDKLEALLKLQDEQIQTLANLQSARVDPVFQSAAARDLVRELNALGDREDVYSSWVQTGRKTIKDAAIDFPVYPIYSEILEKDMSSLTIDIPSTYKHLLALTAGKCTQAGTSYVSLSGQFNGDTGSNYARQNLWGDNTTPAANRFSSASYVDIGTLGSAGAEAGASVAFIPHYLSGYSKYALCWYVSLLVGIGKGNWSNTEPIRQITLFAGADDIAAGSVISLYGIR